MTQEPFKVMEWLRKVREEDYERYKDSPPEVYIRETHEKAQAFLKKLEENRKKSAQPNNGGNS